MKFLDEAAQHASTSFYDIASDRLATVRDLIEDAELWSDARRRLAFLYLDGSLDSISALLCAWKAGHAVVLHSDQMNALLKVSIEARYRPYFIYDRKRPVVDGYLAVPQTRFLRKLIDASAAEYSIGTDVDVLLSTSGTTGSAKLVKLSYANLMSNARAITQYLPILPSDVTPLNLPLSYAYGLSVLTSHLLIGGRLVTSVRNALNKQFWKDFTQLKMTSLAGTPDFYEFLQTIGFQDWSLPSLRYLTQAGGKLHPSTVKRFARYANERSIPFYVMYGQTEATARMAYLAPNQCLENPESIGRPIEGGVFRIDPESSELCYRGANVFGGYAERLEDLASYEPQDELRTGDLARIDAEGLYYITGRLKRIGKLMGVRINLDELEQLLQDRFGGYRFYCLQSDERHLVVASEAGAPESSAVSDFCRERFGIPRAAIRSLYVERLPLSANGKADYAQLLRRAEQSTTT